MQALRVMMIILKLVIISPLALATLFIVFVTLAIVATFSLDDEESWIAGIVTLPLAISVNLTKAVAERLAI